MTKPKKSAFHFSGISSEDTFLKQQQESELEPTENQEDSLKSSKEKRGLYNLNKNLAIVARELANQNEINGLLLVGLPLTAVTKIAEPLVDQKTLDKQAAGVAVIHRFQQILPDRFVLNSHQPFTWKDPYSGKKYKFQLSGGNLTQKQLTKLPSPRVLRGVEANSAKEVFVASSLDNKHWRIEKCDFNSSQLSSLAKAVNLQPKNQQKSHTNSHNR